MAIPHFAKAVSPPRLAVPAWWWLPIALGGLYAGMALTQLANFEGFVLTLESYELATGNGATTLAVMIATVEILALPVLFGLLLSPAMRTVSAASVLLTPVVWAVLAIWALLNEIRLVDSGLFGSLLPKPFGWWFVLGTFVLLAAAISALYILGYVKSASKRKPGKAEKG